MPNWYASATSASSVRTKAELRRSPHRSAPPEAFGVEEIVDPRETRPYLCRFIDAAQSSLRTKNADSRIPPMPIGHDVSAAVAMFKSDRTAIEHDATSTVRDLGICATLTLSHHL
jgi:hypothetical protein